MTRRLHIGGEQTHTDWEIFNIQPGPYVDHVGDARDLSCFADETFDEIYASHVLEHFDYTGSLQKALKHWYRVLKPNGKLYISVPNMNILCKLFLMQEKFSVREHFEIMQMLFGGHTNEYDYHLVGFCPDILYGFLATVGFKKVKQMENLGVFKDTSLLRIGGVLISINVIALK